MKSTKIIFNFKSAALQFLWLILIHAMVNKSSAVARTVDEIENMFPNKSICTVQGDCEPMIGYIRFSNLGEYEIFNLKEQKIEQGLANESSRSRYISLEANCQFDSALVSVCNTNLVRYRSGIIENIRVKVDGRSFWLSRDGLLYDYNTDTIENYGKSFSTELSKK